ncbi:hypothetical protein [Streptosporangium roseum]|uniref:Uncharacterized protein n=1 Tax=Streptosporangium roseum (strain ATCC 12428 / DSM 43021 / JCM 3005 / KCTC 9067 / NCIMB 10171 / NRRL 2505 / NI 9100) TaxID=479432 RepID=D2AZ48_STRRD|nr:hypothetical protein [Streptosporangium roseum]ACZ83233.1 hypothetical protein Sros_0183 [Streptosporangium roseum DSM 43021]
MGYPPPYGRPPKGETGRGLAVIVIMIVGLLIGAALSVTTVLDPAASSKSPPAARDSEHSETTVRQAAQVGLDAYSGGSYGDFWDLWSAQAQAAVAREEYVRLFQLCPQPVPDVRFAITTVTVTGDDARVQAARSGATTDFAFRYEGGSWRYVPPPEELQEYRTQGVDQLARLRQAAGTCGTAASTPPTSAPSVPDPSASAPSVPGPATSAPSVPDPSASVPAVPDPSASDPAVPDPATPPA